MEEWKDIEGFEGYKVSTLGKVKGIKRDELKGAYTTQGYKTVLLAKNNKYFRKLVHRLVAEAFLSNPENKEFVDHINRDITNNSIDNLRWATRTENCLNNKNRERGYIKCVWVVSIPGFPRKRFGSEKEAIAYRDSLL